MGSNRGNRGKESNGEKQIEFHCVMFHRGLLKGMNNRVGI